ncbi:MAG TPA: threo-3-hydroxy-L-aspartate ammonia-lyase [Rhodothermales bacterium]|nr:threo-3-hydroxy-L-aspartate ammonia-lyase [Rhodothermales bacterium]
MSSVAAPAPPVSDVPTFADVQAAAARLAGVAHRTPVVTSRTVDARTGAQVFFKCENLQRAGAFKFRGAYNALAQLSHEARARGVLTFSSGNHAGALALAGRLLGVPITVVMPQTAPRVKAEATRGYGAEIVFYDPGTESREVLGARLAAERGLHVIPPYDHADIIAGQGTAALELLEETGPLDLLLVPTGGGGLLAGSALAAHAYAAECRVVGVEPEAGDDGRRSLLSGTIQTVSNPQTIADGARTPSLGVRNFAVIRARVSEIVTVDDDALLDTLRFVWQRLKLVVEPTGCLGAAALLHGQVDARGLRVGVIFSGGNADLSVVC